MAAAASVGAGGAASRAEAGEGFRETSSFRVIPDRRVFRRGASNLVATGPETFAVATQNPNLFDDHVVKAVSSEDDVVEWSIEGRELRSLTRALNRPHVNTQHEALLPCFGGKALLSVRGGLPTLLPLQRLPPTAQTPQFFSSYGSRGLVVDGLEGELLVSAGKGAFALLYSDELDRVGELELPARAFKFWSLRGTDWLCVAHEGGFTVMRVALRGQRGPKPRNAADRKLVAHSLLRFELSQTDSEYVHTYAVDTLASREGRPLLAVATAAGGEVRLYPLESHEGKDAVAIRPSATVKITARGGIARMVPLATAGLVLLVHDREGAPYGHVCSVWDVFAGVQVAEVGAATDAVFLVGGQRLVTVGGGAAGSFASVFDVPPRFRPLRA
jgi:hypothetical protein